MVLIVEDDPKLGASLERMFRYAGHEAVTAPNAFECIALLGLRKPELIIIDLGLPHIDGLTLLRSIRTDAAFNDVPVVIYSANFSNVARDECLRSGAAEYIVKGTIGWESLLLRFQKYLKPKESTDRPRPRV